MLVCAAGHEMRDVRLRFKDQKRVGYKDALSRVGLNMWYAHAFYMRFARTFLLCMCTM